MENTTRLLAVMVMCLAAGTGSVEARADDTAAPEASVEPRADDKSKEEAPKTAAEAQADDKTAPETPKSSSFRTEAPEHEPPVEEPEEVEGYWRVGKETWLKVAGFVMLDAIHDFDAIGSRTYFASSTIPVDGGTPALGSEGQTTFSYRQTRLSLDSRTRAGEGMIRAFTSVDVFGGSDDDPRLRIRQAFFRLERLVGGGDLTIGQTWTYFMDAEALPETLDYEGPAYSAFLRQPLIGWRKFFNSGGFGVSVEKPGSLVAGADGLTGWPDLVVTGGWRGERWGHVRLAGVVRQLRASRNDGPVSTAAGGGVMASGQLLFGKRQDNVAFQFVFGKGVARYLDDPPPDAIYNPATDSLDTVRTLSGYASLRHWWSDVLRTNAVFSYIDVDLPPSQPGDARVSARYAALNLIWSPYTHLDLGIEVLHGTRNDHDGQKAGVTRLQFSGKYAF